MDAYQTPAQQRRQDWLIADGGASGLAMDEITGFLTQRSLRQLLKDPQHCRPEQALSLLAVELTQFDLIGIGAGLDHSEQLIARLGRRLVRLFPHALAFVRLADARIGVLLAADGDVETPVQRLGDFLQRPVAIAGQIIVADIRIGIASLPAFAIDRSGLVAAVIAALRHAEASSRRVCHFEPAMLSEARRAQTLENDLRVALVLRSIDIYDAVNDAEFSLHYQPIVDVTSGFVHGLEALARWRHPKLGPISPAIFVPIAERIGLMQLLGDWIIQTAMVDAMAWAANPDGSLPRLSINLSGTQFADADALLATIRTAIDHAGIDPARITFEMTESTHLSDKVTPHLDALRAIGCSLAIDDFGTGYSSLAMLVELPLDYLKIDRSLVRDIDAPQQRTARRARRLIASVIGIAEGMGLQPIVEGVETRAQLATVGALGVDLIQGLVYSPPLAAGDVGQFIASNRSERTGND
jgi:EAL domain-containing protein (putative c-di-GMP-specific phosphodiesterase class I)/GGDEF domain-containing protein